MARQAKAKKEEKEVSLEVALWAAANKLRGAVEPSEYKHVVLSLIFLKYANDKFNAQREKIRAEGKEQFLEMLPFYTKDNVFFVPECSRWDFIMKAAKAEPEGLAVVIDTALSEIEKKNPALKGALPDNYYSRLALDGGNLATLLDDINKIDVQKEADKDIFGRVYEYCLGKFALQEGKGKGEYFTPKTVVALIAELIEPFSGIVYDGACGSGGMFVQSMKFIEEHKGNRKNISVYGQEYTATTMKLAKMNLAIRGIAANFGAKAANTFTNDQHKDLKADFAMMNPPFNQKDWRKADELLDDPRWKGYTVPPTSNANFGWLLNILSKLNQNGVAGVLLANGALSGSGDEGDIRRQMIENDVVEAIILLPRNLFYTTDISTTLWILNKNKKERTAERNGEQITYRNRENEVLFIDLRQEGHPYEKKYVQFLPEDLKKVADVFHAWRQVDREKYEDIPEFCYSATKEEIASNDYSLVPSRYIEFINRDESVDFDIKMKALQAELVKLLVEEEKSKADLLKVFKELGYEIKL